jgi:hypothetical protein
LMLMRWVKEREHEHQHGNNDQKNHKRE